MTKTLFEQIKHFDKVTIVDLKGVKSTGRAVMFNPKVDAWVLNMGGRHGTPAFADFSNVVGVRRTK